MALDSLTAGVASPGLAGAAALPSPVQGPDANILAFLEAMINAHTSADADARAATSPAPNGRGDATDATGISPVPAVVSPWGLPADRLRLHAERLAKMAGDEGSISAVSERPDTGEREIAVAPIAQKHDDDEDLAAAVFLVMAAVPPQEVRLVPTGGAGAPSGTRTAPAFVPPAVDGTPDQSARETAPIAAMADAEANDSPGPPPAAAPEGAAAAMAPRALAFFRALKHADPDTVVPSPGAPAPEPAVRTPAAPAPEPSTPASADARSSHAGSGSDGDRGGDSQWLRDPRSTMLDAGRSASMMPLGFAPSIELSPMASADAPVPEGAHAPLPNEHAVAATLVRSMQWQYRNGVGSAIVNLDPGYLGDVKIALQVAAGQVTATLHASSAEVRSWIQANESTLRENLAAQGLSLESLVVVDEDAQEPRTSPDDRRQQDAQEPHQPQPRRPPRRESLATFEVVI